MDIAQRREAIKQIILEQQEVRTAELLEQFDVSNVTLRSDLIYLERTGVCKRLFGKVVASNRTVETTPELIPRINEKERIGKYAASLIREGDAVLFYAGTTTLQAARFVDPALHIIAVTNSLHIALELQKLPHAQVVILGGPMHKDLCATFGVQTVQQVRSLHFDKLLMSVDGIEAQMGITNAKPFESELNHVVLECADQTIIVADHTKVGTTSFIQMGSADAVDLLVTDTAADADAVEALRQAGVEVVVV